MQAPVVELEGHLEAGDESGEAVGRNVGLDFQPLVVHQGRDRVSGLDVASGSHPAGGHHPGIGGADDGAGELDLRHLALGTSAGERRRRFADPAPAAHQLLLLVLEGGLRKRRGALELLETLELLADEVHLRLGRPHPGGLQGLVRPFLSESRFRQIAGEDDDHVPRLHPVPDPDRDLRDGAADGGGHRSLLAGDHPSDDRHGLRDALLAHRVHLDEGRGPSALPTGQGRVCRRETERESGGKTGGQTGSGVAHAVAVHGHGGTHSSRMFHRLSSREPPPVAATRRGDRKSATRGSERIGVREPESRGDAAAVLALPPPGSVRRRTLPRARGGDSTTDSWSNCAHSDVESLEWTTSQAVQRLQGGLSSREFSAAHALGTSAQKS